VGPRLRLENSRNEFERLHANGIAPRQQLRSAIATARRLGYYQIEYEARLALAVADLKTNPSLGRSQLETLEKETHERGRELLSHKAELLVSVKQSSLSNP
jgi:hypothetical protein